MKTEMISEISCNNKLQLQIPATLESIDRVEEETINFITDNDINIDLFAVRIMVREAMANAVIHGCGKNSSMIIQFEISITEDDKLILKVRDSGEGFNWRTLARYNDILADRGRGLPIMEIYADEMYFNEEGNEVTLIKSFDTSNDGRN